MKSMNLKRKLPKLVIVSMLIVITGLIVASALPYKTGPGALVDEHWWHIIISDDEAMTAAAIHDIDALGVPRPADLDWFLDDPSNAPYGWTITSTTRSGYTFVMENNRVWPFGTPSGNPDETDNWRAMRFRRGIHRLIDKDEIIGIYAPLMSKAEAWLPPALAYWNNPDISLPSFDPSAAAAEFDLGGWVEGTKSNPYYDPDWHPASAQYLRVDPVLGGPVSFEYYVMGPVESPLGWEMGVMITGWMRKMGLTVDLVAGTWLGMVFRLVNDDLYDYEMMTGVGITHGLPPDILYDYTYHRSLPLWNFAGMNISDLNYWGTRLMSTLVKEEAQNATWEMQLVLAEYEPYFPMLLWEMFYAYTDPWPEATEPFANPGFIGIVNMPSFGGLASQNLWGKKMGRTDRYVGEAQISKWRLGAYLDTLNPLTADTVPDWQVLTPCMGGHLDYNAYTLQEDYMWYGAAGMPTIEKWIGPGSAEVTGPGNGVYDADVTYDAEDELATYNGIPVEDVTEDDLLGDDRIGMKTTWTIKDDLYWHDSDPGPDLKFGTADDGTVYPVTAEDYKFGWDLIIDQDNVRYYGTWQFISDIKIKSTYSYTMYEERRFFWAFEDHGSGYLAPKHIWEPWIAGDDGLLWTDDDNDHRVWFGWENKYMLDPVRQRLGLSDMWLTELIGFGPFVYHYGGWAPGQYAHFETNPVYFQAIYGSDPLIGDTNLDGSVFIDDLYIIIGSFGLHPNVDADYDPRADTAYPAQTINLDDMYAAAGQLGSKWYP